MKIIHASIAILAKSGLEQVLSNQVEPFVIGIMSKAQRLKKAREKKIMEPLA